MTTQPSPAQFKFIADLLAQVGPDATGIVDVPAAIAALEGTPSFDKRTASNMIKQLLTLKAAAQSQAQAGLATAATAQRTNNHQGKCHTCKAQVAERAGYIVKSSTGKWLVFHQDGACPQVAAPQAPATPATQVEVGLYCHQDGPEVEVWRVYIGRQSGHRQASKLVTYDDHGVFEYVKGGTRVVDQGVAAGTLRLITAEEAHAFGSLHDWCVNCGLVIEDDRSKAAGYGPTCAANNGWFYPNHQQAANILKRPVTRPSGVVVAPNDCGCGPDAIQGEPCLNATPNYKGEYPLH